MRAINKYIVFFIMVAITFLGCKKDQVQAEDSLRGEWQVTELVSQYGSFSNGTFIEISTLKEIGQLGKFTFGKSEVSYNFTRNDTLYSETAPWKLAYEKANSGFTRVPEFTLDIGQQFSFDVFFEDGTKNVEKNAKRALLTQIPQKGDRVVVTLEIEKVR